MTNPTPTPTLSPITNPTILTPSPSQISLPSSANWRKDIIPDWNAEFEQEYQANLMKPIIYEDPDLDKEDVSIKEIEETAKETKRKDLEAKRDG